MWGRGSLGAQSVLEESDPQGDPVNRSRRDPTRRLSVSDRNTHTQSDDNLRRRFSQCFTVSGSWSAAPNRVLTPPGEGAGAVVRSRARVGARGLGASVHGTTALHTHTLLRLSCFRCIDGIVSWRDMRDFVR